MISWISHIVFVLVTVFCLAQVSSSQSTAITEQEYWNAIRTANAETRKVFPRRQTETYISATDGKETYLRIEVSEYISSDTFRTTKTVDRIGTKSISQLIQIGTKRYCRENLADWKNSGCYEQPPAPLGDSIETTYSLETTKKTKTYIRIAKSEHFEKGKTKPTTFLTVDKFVVNNDLTVRQRSIEKIAADSKALVSRESKKLEYNVKLKPVEAPIK